jgi:hypothetical protein
VVEIVWEEFGLIRVLSGPLSVEEMDSSAQRIQAHPQIDDMRYNIHDFTGVTDAVLQDDDIEFMAIRAGIAVQRNARLRIAFVGTHPVVHKLMAAFNQSGCSRLRVQRFDTLADARHYAAGNSPA